MIFSSLQKLGVCWYALSVLPCSNIVAQNNVEKESFSLNPIVVTATGTHARQNNAVGDVRVLSAEEIHAAHITSIEDALVMLAPGFSTMTNGMGTTLSLNGLNDDYILILVDGKRVTGEDRLSRINFASIKRIEVLNGAAATLYGSDAVAGVINIITNQGGQRRTETDKSIHVAAQNYTQFSSKGRFTESVTADIRAGHLISSSALQLRKADNWQVNNTELVLNQLKPTGRVTSQAFRNRSIDQRFAWNFNNGLQVFVRGAYNNYHTDRPQAATYFKGSTKKTGEQVFTETPAYTYDLARQTYTYGFGASWRINNRTYLEADFNSDNLISERDSFNTSVPGGKQLTKKTNLYNTSLKGIFNFDSHKLSVGMEYMHETYRSYNFEGRNMYTLALYAQDEWQIARWFKAVGGVRYVQNELFGATATPNVQLLYSPGNFRIRSGYGMGFRSPTLVQIFYENDETKTITRGNHDLQPEKSHFVTLSANYVTSSLNIGISTSYNTIRDMISYRTLTDTEISEAGLDTHYPTATKFQQRDNINSAHVFSLTASLSWLLPCGLNIGGSYTFLDTDAKSVALDKDSQSYLATNEPIDRSVRHSGNMHAAWNKSWKSYTLGIRLQGLAQGERWSTSYGFAPSFSQFDLNTTHAWNIKGSTLELSLGMENLFNTRDERPWCSNLATLHPGRCVMSSFRILFKN